MGNMVDELYRERNVVNGTAQEKLEAILRKVFGENNKTIILSSYDSKPVEEHLALFESLYRRGELDFLAAA